MFDTIRKTLQKDDNAVSAVIGTILMIAATVILGGAIYAATNGFGQKDTVPKEDYLFKAVAADTDGDQVNDAVKLTYVSGPDLGVSAMDITFTDADGTDVVVVFTGAITGQLGSASTPPTGTMAAGKSAFLRLPDGSDAGSEPDALATGTYLLTIAVGGTTIVDATVKI